MKYPQAIQNLINNFTKLPTVGPKTAERYVFYLLKQSGEDLQKLAQAIAELKEGTKTCGRCFAIAEADPCPICSDKKRHNFEGETTALYLAKILKPLNVKITRLAKGLPMGADLEYADEITLTHALKYRNTL